MSGAAASSPGYADDSIRGIGPTGKVTAIHTGFQFTEGPAADAAGNVYFTDIPANRIHKIDLDGKLSTFLENSERANGLMVDGKGRLIACQGGAGKVIAIDPATKAITVLADKYADKRLNSPNDLVIDRQGGIYFTDPSFGGTVTQDKMAVYYRAPDGKLTRLIDDLILPNGVILSPDEKTLYVLPSGSPDVMAYTVESPGKISKGRVFCSLAKVEGNARPGGDGMSVDTAGNLYLTHPSKSAIQVVDASGKTLGLIQVPEGPANCTFGGKDMKTLFVTARKSVYAIPMESTGHRFPAGK
jgi:gluconolactonase